MSGSEIQPNPKLPVPIPATTRFSNRVENYLRYRPRYPREVLKVLIDHHGLIPRAAIADIGSGTGILAELFVDHGNLVHAIEPNRHMREAAERIFTGEALFQSHNGTAENTGLEAGSIDFITAAQSFHWFHPEKCRREFQRILRAGGRIVLIWNDRRTDSTPFLRDYEALLQKYGTDYRQVDHKGITLGLLTKFFGTEPRGYTFPNHQKLDWEGIKGRLLSSSYVPVAGQTGHQEMLRDLHQLFSRSRSRGNVTLEYDTRMFVGNLS